jgi:hypothetical protein
MALTPDLLDWRERRYISQFSPDDFGLMVHAAGAPADADGPVTAAWVQQNADGTVTPVSSYTAIHSAVGVYDITLTSADTGTPGDYSLNWSWTQAGQAQQYVIYAVVGVANQAYDALSDDLKTLVDDVWYRFADCFDSPSGGPNLQTYYQAHWSRGRMAQIMKTGLGRINAVAQPHLSYTLDGVGGSVFPVAQWGPLLATQTYVEALKHLRRSYVEQPMFMGGNVTRQDRRDYLDRWGLILTDEMATLQGEMDTFKISMMGLGRPRVLVAGGVYGRYAPTRVAGSVAARPRYYARFYS